MREGEAPAAFVEDPLSVALTSTAWHHDSRLHFYIIPKVSRRNLGFFAYAD